MQLLDTSQPDFDAVLGRLLSARHDPSVDRAVEDRVRHIVQDVRTRGDVALLEWTRELDSVDVETARELVVTPDEIAAAVAEVGEQVIADLRLAATRIRVFHQRQREESWSLETEEGIKLGHRVVPLRAVGVYVPGGTAAYPSSVLMNVIPAHVAGVDEIVMVTPTPGGRTPPAVLAAAHVAGVTTIIRVGGAQAVAALAYGTHTVPRVDKIVGPGNQWVATAKRQVFGVVDIDMIAGPSELCVVATNAGGATPAVLAADLLSQAEHDTQAMISFVSPDADLVEAVRAQVAAQVEELPRADIARASVANFGVCIHTRDLDEALAVADRIAPEHLELVVEDAEGCAARIRNAGAIFCGPHTPEAVGDYIAGTNHVLPTNGTARFSSALGVYDFQKRINLIRFSAEGLRALGPACVRLAELEGLEAHAASVRRRLHQGDG